VAFTPARAHYVAVSLTPDKTREAPGSGSEPGTPAPLAPDGYAVVAESVTKCFGDVEVLSGASLSISAGTTFGLLGPNGSGKTTLLRILAGILRPGSGTTRVLGRPMRHGTADVGFMPQQVALYPRITVYENLRYFAGMQGAAKRDLIDDALSAVGLLELKHRRLSELSQGTQRRASLACTLVHRPRLLLLDEPTTGVDPLLRLAFWEHFRRLNEQGVTIVLATHDMDEAERCDTLAVLREGRILVQGSPAEVCRQQGVDSVEAVYLRLAQARDA
jgi:ABC-2 type transport system ATP-binding protein